ncbi:phosphatase PAP2 family protein [Sphingomonas morindae]|uniref:Phosphatase PAP2 family protein n=1 Tax=Sphingomonas morindae TaxID=1541170 RepID=A0ABY4XBJ6_9SPHN|nr:phosphatase PAP2 family protein [Sphingomonas morindae]USI74287.1 phosphatase PAP2 family protein [Sphingomonas morindae]
MAEARPAAFHRAPYQPPPALLLTAGGALLLLGLLSWRLGWDVPLHSFFRLGPADRWVRQIISLSALGGLLVIGPIATLVALGLAWRGRGRDAAWLAITLIVGRLGVEAIKLLVLRPRPPALDRLELVGSWSFPSAHSAGTMMAALALAALTERRGAWLAGLAFSLAIGWTRLALAVHWPGDVLAGWGLGLIWIAGALAARRPARR